MDDIPTILRESPSIEKESRIVNNQLMNWNMNHEMLQIKKGDLLSKRSVEVYKSSEMNHVNSRRPKKVYNYNKHVDRWNISRNIIKRERPINEYDIGKGFQTRIYGIINKKRGEMERSKRSKVHDVRPNTNYIYRGSGMENRLSSQWNGPYVVCKRMNMNNSMIPHMERSNPKLFISHGPRIMTYLKILDSILNIPDRLEYGSPINRLSK